MGQHSSAEHWPFYRSFLGWVVPCGVIVLVVVAAVWLAVGPEDGERGVQSGRPAAASSAVSETRAGDPAETDDHARDGARATGSDRLGDAAVSGGGGSSKAQGGAGSGSGSGSDAIAESKSKPDGNKKPLLEVEVLPLVTDGVTVQVLASTPSPQTAADMAGRLGDLGFDVISIESSARDYPKTTVFWSFSKAQKPALRLAGRFGWRAAPKPANLSSQVDVHVVVGADEA